MLLLLLGGASDPSSLFRSGEPGGFWDPSDFSHQFQDANGTIPVTSPGDPVGLTLDKSRGGLNNLGPELVTNGSLDNSTGWTVIGAGVAITGGQAVWTAATGEIAWSPLLTVGRWYRLEVELTSYTSGVIAFRDGTTNTTIATTGAAPGRRVFFINATSQQIRFITFSPATLAIDNISIREIPGVHRFQTVSASRKLLARIPQGGRRNLFVRSEELDSASWLRLQCSVTPNVDTAPDGTLTADAIVEDSANAARYAQQSLTATIQAYTFSVYLKQPTTNGRRFALLYHNESVRGIVFDLLNGTVGVGGTAGVSAPTASGIEPAGNGWFRCWITTTATAGTNNWRVYPVTNNGSGLANYLGDGVSRILSWGAQLETGSSATAYQRVGINADVTEAGRPDCWGWLYDGLDDSDLTNAVDFSGTDKMTVLSAVRKNSDAATGMFAELTINASSTNGSFYLCAPELLAGDFTFFSRGTLGGATSRTEVTGRPAPVTVVLANQGDIAAPIVTTRTNGALVSSDTGTQGVGNFSNSPLFFGRRNNASLPFNGYEFGTIIRGAATAEATIRDLERVWLASRAGISF